MNDEDYIKAAVELADGWRIVARVYYRWPVTGDCLLMVNEMPKPHLDALAAQLARQARGKWEFIGGSWFTLFAVSINDGDSLEAIKTIVDSRIL